MPNNRVAGQRAGVTPTGATRATRATAAAFRQGLSPMGSGPITINGGGRLNLADEWDDSQADATPMLWRCIDLIRNPASTLQGEVYRRSTGETVPEHAVAALWNGQANKEMSGHTLLSTVIAQLCSPIGQAFAYLNRPNIGSRDFSVASLWPLTDTVEIIPGEPTREEPTVVPKEYHARVGAKWYSYQPEEILHFKHTGTNPFLSRNVLKPAQTAILLQALANEYLVRGLKEGAAAGGVLHLGQHDNADTAKQAARSVKRTMESPANSQRIVATSGPTQPVWIPFGLSPVDLALIDTLRLTDEQIILALNVPRDLAIGESTYANRAQARAELWENAILPLLRIIEAEITRRMLLDSPDLAFRFDLSKVDALKEHRKAQVAAAAAASTTNVMTADEIREEFLDLDPFPAGLGNTLPSALMSALMMGTALPAEVEAGTPAPLDEATVRSILAASPDVDVQAALISRIGAARALPAPTEAPLVVEATRAKTTFDPLKTAKKYDALEARYKTAVRELFEEQREDVLNRLGRTRKKGNEGQVLLSLYESTLPEGERTEALRVSLGDLFDPKRWIDRGKRLLRPAAEKVWTRGADDLAVIAEIDDAGVYDDKVTEAMEARLTWLVGQVNRTTEQAISEAVLKPGVEGGDSVDKLADRLTARFDSMTSSHAKTVARTEVVSGFNSAQQTLAEAAGLQMGKRWHAKIDTRTRDSHEHLHGHFLDSMDGKFPNDLLFPGDPRGKASEVINCRCVVEYVPA